MRVGIVRGGMEVEIWKRHQAETGRPPVKDSEGQRIIRAGEQIGGVPQLFAAAGTA